MRRALSLSVEQKDRLMARNRETVRAMMEHRNRLSLKMFDLNTELRKAEPDEAAVDGLVDEIASMRAKMLEGRVEAIRGMRGMR